LGKSCCWCFSREIANQELKRKGSVSAHNALLVYLWQGNVRELKKRVQTAVLQAEGNVMSEEDWNLVVNK